MAWIGPVVRAGFLLAVCAVVDGDEGQPLAADIGGPDGDRPGRSIKAQLQTARQQAETATTFEDYGAILDQCRRVRRFRLSPRAAAYVNQLASWAHNRRGRLVAAQATAAEQEEDNQRAQTLENQALDDFEAAVRFDARAWRAIHNRGVSRAKLGRFEAAVQDFTTALQLHPQHADAWFNRAETRTQLGQYREAVDDYTQALLLHGDDAGTLSGRAWARVGLQQYDKALADLEKAIQLQPENADHYADRASLLTTMGHWEDAATDYRTAIQLDTNLGRAYQGAAWLMATCPVVRYRDPQLALRAARKAVTLSGPKDIACLETLAAALAAMGEFSQACDTLNQAIELARDDLAQPLKSRLQLYENERLYLQPHTPRKTAWR